jgi:hypothetical protein
MQVCSQHWPFSLLCWCIYWDCPGAHLCCVMRQGDTRMEGVELWLPKTLSFSPLRDNFLPTWLNGGIFTLYVRWEWNLCILLDPSQYYKCFFMQILPHIHCNFTDIINWFMFVHSFCSSTLQHRCFVLAVFIWNFMPLCSVQILCHII